MQIHKDAQFSDVRALYRSFTEHIEIGALGGAELDVRDLRAIVAGDNALVVKEYAGRVLYSAEAELAEEQELRQALFI